MRRFTRPRVNFVNRGRCFGYIAELDALLASDEPSLDVVASLLIALDSVLNTLELPVSVEEGDEDEVVPIAVPLLPPLVPMTSDKSEVAEAEQAVTTACASSPRPPTNVLPLLIAPELLEGSELAVLSPAAELEVSADEVISELDAPPEVSVFVDVREPPLAFVLPSARPSR